MGKGLKYDQGKQNWYALPLVLLEPLADVFRAGEFKYETFNCLEPFEDSDRRFYDGQMRHTRESQMNPLAIDEELMGKYGQKVYHQAQIAFNALLRLHNALRNQEGKEEVRLTEEEMKKLQQELAPPNWHDRCMSEEAIRNRNITTYSSVSAAPERFKS